MSRKKHAEGETPSPSSSMPEIARGLVKESLIVRMEAEYKASYQRRFEKEKEYVATHNLQSFCHPTEKLFIANFTVLYDIFRITIKDSASLVQNVFEDFNHLVIDHRVTLLKHFASTFLMTECFYYNNKYFKRSDGMFMASLITCADFNNLDEYVADDDSKKQGITKKDAFRTTLKGYANEYIYLFDSMAKMEQLTEREFYALAVLNYCDVDTSLYLPDEIMDSAHKIRAILFEELQEYYRTELKINDFSKRLGNLMTLSQGTRVACNLMIEEMRLYATVFDLYSDDKLFREFFVE